MKSVMSSDVKKDIRQEANFFWCLMGMRLIDQIVKTVVGPIIL